MTFGLGQGFAVTHMRFETGGPSDPPRIPLELWVAEVESGQARRLLSSPEQGLNTVFDK